MLVEIIKNEKGRKDVKINGNEINNYCAEVDIYESPGEPTKVVITLIDVDVKIKNQIDIID
jgi:hypothetical protein